MKFCFPGIVSYSICGSQMVLSNFFFRKYSQTRNLVNILPRNPYPAIPEFLKNLILLTSKTSNYQENLQNP